MTLTVGIVLAVVVLAALIASWYKDTRSFIFPFFGPNNEALSVEVNNHIGETSVGDASQISTQGARSADAGHPSWADLTEPQQTILQGLQEVWPFFSNAEKRRWLATAHSARTLSPEQQATMATQIGHWSKLSEAQRSEMRLLFEAQSEQQKGDAQEAWMAYNQLSEAERNQFTRLALGSAAAQTARAKKPQNSRLVRIPAASQARPQLANLPKIQQEAPKTAAPPAQNTITHDASSKQGNDTGNTRQYRWGNIIVTPPDPLPPLYRN